MKILLTCGKGYLFSFSPVKMLPLAGTELFALLLGTVFSVLRTLRTGGEEEKPGLPISRRKCLKTDLRQNLFRIYRNAHIKSVLLWCLIFLTVSGTCQAIVFAAYKSYTFSVYGTDASSPDFIWAGNGGSASMDAAGLNAVRATEGIGMADASYNFSCDSLTWTGKEKSAYQQIIVKNREQAVGTGVVKPSVIAVDFGSDYGRWILDQASTKDIKEGSVILCLPAIITDGKGGYDIYTEHTLLTSGQQILNEDTIRSGDELQMTLNGVSHSFLVAGVIRKNASDLQYAGRFCSEGMVFMSRETAAALISDSLSHSNYVSAYLSGNADGTLSAGLSSRIKTNGLSFSNMYEDKARRFQNFITMRTFFLLLAGIVLIAHCFLACVQILHTLYAENEKLRLLTDLGADKKKLRLAAVRPLLKFGLLLDLAGTAVFLSVRILPLTAEIMASKRLSFRYSLQNAARLGLYNFPWAAYLIFGLVIAVLPAFLLYCNKRLFLLAQAD